MRKPTILRPDLTLARYGYDTNTIHSGSHSVVIVQCTGCNSIIHRQFRNYQASHSCPIVDGNKKRCCKCEEWKDFSFFPKNSKKSGGVGKLCKWCFNNHDSIKRYEYRRGERLKIAIKELDFSYYIDRRMSRLKSAAKAKGIPWNLDLQYLKDIWQQQSGLCHYSEIKMDGQGQKMAVWNSPSLDKMDPSLGYVKGNVVWCIYAINSFKGELTEQEFSSVVKSANWWYR